MLFVFLFTSFSKIGLIPLRVMSETREIANIYTDPYETWAAWFSETAATFPHVALHGSSHKPLCGTPGSRPWQIYVQICPPISGGWFPSLRDREGSPARRKQTCWERAAARDKRWTRDAERTGGMEAERTIFLTLKGVGFFFLFISHEVQQRRILTADGSRRETATVMQGAARSEMQPPSVKIAHVCVCVIRMPRTYKLFSCTVPPWCMFSQTRSAHRQRQSHCIRPVHLQWEKQEACGQNVKALQCQAGSAVILVYFWARRSGNFIVRYPTEPW